LSHVRAKSLGYNYEVENASECEDLNNKALLTDQAVDIFVEEQENPSSKASEFRRQRVW